MWLEYLPDACIYGIDIDRAAIRRTLRICDNDPRLKLKKMDQADKEAQAKWAEELGVQFDVVLDDGSHRCSHQIKSFEALWPYVAPGGLYIIEDVFTSYWLQSKHGYVDQDETCIEYFKKFVDEVNLIGRQITGKGYADFNCVKKTRKLNMIETTVESIQFANGFLVVYKR